MAEQKTRRTAEAEACPGAGHRSDLSYSLFIAVVQRCGVRLEELGEFP
jgi:hypothetical protein